MKTKAFVLLLVFAVVSCGGDQEPASGRGAAGQPSGGQPGGAAAAAPTAPAGASAAADASLAKGLAWLKGQAKKGIWYGPDPKGNLYPSVAHTALALAPVAASLPPEKRAADPLVRQAAAFLVKSVGEDGGVHMPGMPTYDNYFTSASLMALEIVGDPAHAETRRKMRDFILTLQRKEEGRVRGGFGYNKAKSADLSNSQFAVEALRAAGIPEDHPSMRQALAYLQRVQNRSENEENKGAVYEVEDKEKGKIKVVPGDDGSAGYEPGVSKAGLRRLPDGTYVPRGYGSMTYALLKCYILVGLDADDARVKAVIHWLGKNYTWDENPGFREAARELNQPEAPYWGLFYYYMTAAKALRLVGVDTLETADGPRDWRSDLAAAIVARQRKDGSWVNEKAKRWEEADPIITTSYALIALQETKGVAR